MPTVDLKQAFWTPANLALVTGGQWLGEPADPVDALTGVGIDSRTIRPGQAFVAIRGENFDGHDFVDSAFTNGAAIAIVTRLAGGPKGPTLRVNDTITALQQLARAWRDVLADHGCKVIAVAGSNGKTTTRHLIHCVLSRKRRGTQSPKSFNNHLGVPLTLLGAAPDHDFVVCEIGTNHPGEVAALADIARPDVAVVTCIGAEHLEFFGSIENVEREEYSLLNHVRDGGVSFTPRDDLGPYPGPLSLPGTHNRVNAAYAVAVARWFGLDDRTIEDALRTVEPLEGRLQTLRFGDVTVIHDAYNANPDSMRCALEVLARSETSRRVAILGDMFELGDASESAHREIAALARKIADEVVLVGEHFGGTAWSDDLPEKVAVALEPGDVVLIKASRGMRLERLLPAIEKRFGGQGALRAAR